MAFGFISCSVLKLVTGRTREVDWAFHLMGAILVLRCVFLPPGT
jgi:xanthine/uracil/vitamin C permease (AzgA family)